MRIESMALLKLSSNLIIRRDSALKYSYYTQNHNVARTRPTRNIDVTQKRTTNWVYQRPMDLCNGALFVLEYTYLLITSFMYLIVKNKNKNQRQSQTQRSGKTRQMGRWPLLPSNNTVQTELFRSPVLVVSGTYYLRNKMQPATSVYYESARIELAQLGELYSLKPKA